MEQPVLVYYSKDFNLSDKGSEKVVHAQLELGPKQRVDSVKTVKTLIYGLDHNEILMRINNLEDKFDAQAHTYTVDVLQYAWELFSQANP